ncbi:GIN domain-containing protein [Massilia sp. CMS3.1]|uniref:GIN domain-containing protein n=1 Tax=Massilia sp. CMS3.1 TaxID=3373083 RepID=UPI003EE52BA6
MTHCLKLGLAALGMLALMRMATAAPDTITETRPLDARVVRIKIDGVVDLRVRQGSPASLVLSGDPRWIANMTTLQSSDTVVIGTEMHEMRMQRKNGVRAEIVIPGLREVRSESVGMTEITGFKGDELELSLDGAGSMNANVDYRIITASLGGVGSMKLAGINSERITLDLQGAGYVSLTGRTQSLRAELGGLGSLDARQFAADAVMLNLSGLGNATVTAQVSANLNLSGMGSVTVYGKPLNRRVSVDGLGKVSWK